MKQLGLSFLFGAVTFGLGFFLARQTLQIPTTKPIAHQTQMVKEKSKPIVTSIPTQLSDSTASLEDISENSVTAWPTRVFQGDELHLVFQGPHGGQLAIEDPDQKLFMVCYDDVSDLKVKPLVDSPQLKKLKGLTLKLADLKGTRDFERMSKVFTKTGWYTIYLSHNLETCDFDYEGRIEIFYSNTIQK